MGVDVEKTTLEYGEIECSKAALNSLGSFYHSWQYNTTMNNLAETWAKEFDHATKFMLFHSVSKHYKQMVKEMEVNHSNYIDDPFWKKQ